MVMTGDTLRQLDEEPHRKRGSHRPHDPSLHTAQLSKGEQEEQPEQNDMPVVRERMEGEIEPECPLTRRRAKPETAPLKEVQRPLQRQSRVREATRPERRRRPAGVAEPQRGGRGDQRQSEWYP